MHENKPLTGYPSIDKPWLKYYSEEAVNAPLPECTVYDSIWQNNKEHLDDYALIYFGRKITYRTVFDQIENVRNAFLSYGVKKGDIVVLFTTSTPETVYAVLALNRIGAVADLINPLFTEEQIVDRINETSADLMIVLDQLYDRIAPVKKQLCLTKIIVVPVYNAMPMITRFGAKLKMKKSIPYSESVISWDSFINEDVNTSPDAPYEKDAPYIMVYSSGSTGASKGIVLTNSGISATLSNYYRKDYLPHERSETMLQMIPLWFSTGIVLSLLMPICVGVTTILEPVFSKESFARDIRKYKPNMTLAATSLWLYAVKCKELKKTDMSSMHYPITGGESVLPRVENSINVFLRDHGCNIPILKGYGMCELGGTVTMDSTAYQKSGSTGYPTNGVTVSAFDLATNKEQLYGFRGELRVSSPCRMKEYFKNPAATAAFFWEDDNGTVWGCTGDMGYVDEDGFVYVLGRCSDSFVSISGQTVYCFDIENEILKNPNVAQCEVVGQMNNAGHTVPVAQIVLEEPCHLTADELLRQIHEHCVNVLTEDCIPHGYKIVDSFPVKNNGKRDMDLIRQDRQGYVMPLNGKVVAVSFAKEDTHHA